MNDPILESALRKVFKGEDDTLSRAERITLSEEKTRLHELIHSTDNLLKDLANEND